MRDKKIVIIIFMVIFVLLGLHTINKNQILISENFSQTPISDRNDVLFTIYQLQKSIQNQDNDLTSNLLDSFYTDYSNNRSMKKSDFINMLKKNYNDSRESNINITDDKLKILRIDDNKYLQDYMNIKTTSTSDFFIEVDSLIISKGNAIATCKLSFVEKNLFSNNISLVLTKRENIWKFNKTENIVNFFNMKKNDIKGTKYEVN